MTCQILSKLEIFLGPSKFKISYQGRHLYLLPRALQPLDTRQVYKRLTFMYIVGSLCGRLIIRLARVVSLIWARHDNSTDDVCVCCLT